MRTWFEQIEVTIKGTDFNDQRLSLLCEVVGGPRDGFRFKLAHPSCHVDQMTWLERATGNGIADHFLMIGKRLSLNAECDCSGQIRAFV